MIFLLILGFANAPVAAAADLIRRGAGLTGGCRIAGENRGEPFRGRRRGGGRIAACRQTSTSAKVGPVPATISRSRLERPLRGETSRLSKRTSRVSPRVSRRMRRSGRVFGLYGETGCAATSPRMPFVRSAQRVERVCRCPRRQTPSDALGGQRSEGGGAPFRTETCAPWRAPFWATEWVRDSLLLRSDPARRGASELYTFYTRVIHRPSFLAS